MKRKIFIPKDKMDEYLDKHMTYKQIAELYNCSYWTIMEIARGYGLRSQARKYQQLENNVCKNPEVKEKISETVGKLWADGTYRDRINGMLGVTGKDNPNFKNGVRKFRDKVLFYQDKKCSICGCTDRKIDIHHVDEDHNNFLLSNLEPVCNVCHQLFHLKKYKMPFESVTKTFEFDSAHYLPNHPKKCKFLHGHSYKLEVTVRRRVNPITGFVIDFGVLKQAVNKAVISVLDHGYINNFLEVPTSENIIVWIWELLSRDVKGLERLRLYETGSSYSEITKPDMLEFVSSYDAEAGWLDDDKVVDGYTEQDEMYKTLEENKC